MQNTALLASRRRSQAEPRSGADARALSEASCFPPLPKPCERLGDLASRLSRTIAVAHALLQGGRTLDLTGMNDTVGALCAQTLDQPLDEARTLLPALTDMLERLDQLSVALRVAARPTPPSSGAPC